MTFHYIYFSHYHPEHHKVGAGWLSICCFSHLLQVFGGMWPQISLFHQCESTQVATQIGFYVIFDMKLSYSIIDIGSISNRWLGGESQKLEITQLAQTWCVEFTQAQKQLNVGRIVASKLEIIQLKAPSGAEIEIFDGPGTLSEKLAKLQSVNNIDFFVTSTFQCVIHAYNSYSLIQFKNEYRNTWDTSDTQVVSPNSSLSYICAVTQANRKDSKFYHLELKTKPGFHINISITNMTHSGENNTLTCDFAGVAVFDGSQEIITLCQKPTFDNNIITGSNIFSAIPYVFQNIYSNNSTVKLILYCYNRYSSVSTAFLFSRTECRSKFIDVCTHPGVTRKATEFADLAGYYSDFYVTPNEGKCIILQLTRSNVRNAEFVNTMCRMNIGEKKTDGIYGISGHIQFNVTGFFRGVFFAMHLTSNKCFMHIQCASF